MSSIVRFFVVISKLSRQPIWVFMLFTIIFTFYKTCLSLTTFEFRIEKCVSIISVVISSYRHFRSLFRVFFYSKYSNCDHKIFSKKASTALQAFSSDIWALIFCRRGIKKAGKCNICPRFFSDDNDLGAKIDRNLFWLKKALNVYLFSIWWIKLNLIQSLEIFPM